MRASCGGVSDTALIQAVCDGGTEPVDGVCPDGQTVGGRDPTATTTTTATTTPGSGGTGGSGGTDGSAGTGGTSSPNPTLAVTGATFAEHAAQIGITLVGFGALVELFAAKRREREIA